MNISATSGPITMKFYQKHHCDGEKAATGFGLDRIKTLVSMATDSSHRFTMEKRVLPLFLSCFSSDPFYTMSPLLLKELIIIFLFAGNDDMHASLEEFEIQPDWTTDCGVSCP